MLSKLKSVSPRAVLGAMALGSTLGIVAAARTGSANIALVYPPISFPAGKSYSQLAASRWQWALTQPTATSPLVDTTGANCAAGQSGPDTVHVHGEVSGFVSEVTYDLVVR